MGKRRPTKIVLTPPPRPTSHKSSPPPSSFRKYALLFACAALALGLFYSPELKTFVSGLHNNGTGSTMGSKERAPVGMKKDGGERVLQGEDYASGKEKEGRASIKKDDEQASVQKQGSVKSKEPASVMGKEDRIKGQGERAAVAEPKAGQIPSTTTSLPPTVGVKEKKLTKQAVEDRAAMVPCKDRHDHGHCVAMAVDGQCELSPGWMAVMCAASCARCDLLDPKVRCSEEHMGIKQTDAWAPGDLNKLFERLSQEPNVDVIRKGDPWVVLINDFITNKESTQILKLTEKELKRSTDQGKMDSDGFQHQVVSNHRTSSNAWCMHQCENDAIVRNLTERIATLINVPSSNFESFQILRYGIGQKYDLHHDGAERDFEKSAGPRILTFFMYFSDVEEGGHTAFPKLNISVKPRKGSAILWPSVLDEFPNSQLDQRTFHVAEPVIKGTKFAANSWIHLRNYKVPNLYGCTGSFTE